MRFLLNEPVYKAIMYNRLEQCGTEVKSLNTKP